MPNTRDTSWDGADDWRADYMKEMALFMDLKEEGREEGREEGIRAFILDKLEDHASTELISAKLQRRFGLTEAQALEEIEKCNL